MTVLYSNDFEASANGALSAFTVVLGAAFTVSDVPGGVAGPVRGAKFFRAGSDGDSVAWNGDLALGNQAFRIAQKYASTSGICIQLRTQIGGGSDRCYRLSWTAGSGADAGKIRGVIVHRDNGTVSVTNEATFSVAVNVGDVVHMEGKAIGTTVELRIWVGGAARPSAPNCTATLTAFATGAAGVRKFGNFENTSCDDLVITDGAGGEDLFYAGPVVGGGATLENVQTGGTLQSSASDIGGGAVLEDIATGGSLGREPGTIVTGLFRSTLTGLPLAAKPIAWCSALRAADGLQVAIFTGRQTDAGAVLTITDGALAKGAAYLLVTYDGAEAYGAEHYVAA